MLVKKSGPVKTVPTGPAPTPMLNRIYRAVNTSPIVYVYEPSLLTLKDNCFNRSVCGS